MSARRVWFALLALGGPACSKIDLDELRFACRTSADCSGSKVCDPIARVCVRPNELTDAGAFPDAAPPDAGIDAGIPDGGGDPDASAGRCFPDRTETTTATEHWWCHGVTSAELDGVLAEHGARLLDLEIIALSPMMTYAAALARRNDGLDSDWAGDVDRDGFGPFFDRGLDLVDYNAFYVGSRLRYAVIFRERPTRHIPWYRAGYTRQGVGDELANLNSMLETDERVRMTDLDRYVDPSGVEKYTFLAPVRHPTRGSTVAFELLPEGIETFARLRTIIDVEPTEYIDRFSVVTSTRAELEGEAHFLHLKTDVELAAELSRRSAYVERILPRSTESGPRFSALIVAEPRSAAERAGGRMGRASAGTVALYAAEVSGSTTAGHREEDSFLSGNLIAPVVLAYALEQIRVGAATFETMIPSYADTGETCPEETVSGAIPLSEALGELVSGARNDRTKSVMRYFGWADIQTFARGLGMSRTAISGDVGCPNDESTTALADLGRLFRAISSGAVLDAAGRAAFDAHMPPRDGDDAELPTAVRAIVAEEEARFDLPTGTGDQLFAGTVIRYASGYRGISGWTRSLAGSVDIPSCPGTVTALFGAAVIGAPSSVDSHTALRFSRAELLREAIREHLLRFASCSR